MIANVIITYETLERFVGEGALNTLLIGRGKVAVRGIFVAAKFEKERRCIDV